MTKKLSNFVWCVASVLLFGCAVKQNPVARTELPLTGIVTSNTQTLPSFNTVAVTGPYDVDVNVSSDPYGVAHVTMTGDSGLMDYTHTYVKANTLRIYLDPAYSYNPNVHVKVVIDTPALTTVSINSVGNVVVQNINTDHFTVQQQATSYVALSGYARRFDATVTGKARLNAKCLQAKAIFVNTTDYAQAEILGQQGISALATGHSDIYYYSTPDMTAPYQRQSGSVMRMEGILPANPATANPQVSMQSNDYGVK
jgi:hypothetical protein